MARNSIQTCEPYMVIATEGTKLEALYEQRQIITRAHHKDVKLR